MKTLFPPFGLVLALTIWGGPRAVVHADDPEPRDPLVAEAEELFRKNRTDDCFEKLKEAAARNKLLPPASLMMARLYLSSNQGQAARMLLEKAIVEHPDHPEVYLTNASVALAEGRILDTLLSCQIALQQACCVDFNAAQQKKFRTEAYAGLATGYEARKDWKKAAYSLSVWASLDPVNVQVRQRLARAYFLTDRFDEAEKELRATAATDPKLDPPELTIARFYAQLVGIIEAPKDDPKQKAEIEKKDAENKKKAYEWFKKAIDKYPENPGVRLAYEAWLHDMKKPNKLKILFDENSGRNDVHDRVDYPLLFRKPERDDRYRLDPQFGYWDGPQDDVMRLLERRVRYEKFLRDGLPETMPLERSPSYEQLLDELLTGRRPLDQIKKQQP
jgi:tetratricopeptide (TPR) repeat protein